MKFKDIGLGWSIVFLVAFIFVYLMASSSLSMIQSANSLDAIKTQSSCTKDYLDDWMTEEELKTCFDKVCNSFKINSFLNYNIQRTYNKLCSDRFYNIVLQEKENKQ